MIAAALALTPTLPAAGQSALSPLIGSPLSATPPVALAATHLAGQNLSKDNLAAMMSLLLGAACRRGQLEDASAAARIALPFSQSDKPQHAVLLALAEAQPALMVAPEEHRLYLLRAADGLALGLLRLRTDGQVSQSLPIASATGAASWTLRDGNLELGDASGQASLRFALCGKQSGQQLYLGEALADGAPRLLQEVSCTYSRLLAMDPELVSPFCSLFGADEWLPAPLPARSALLLANPHAGDVALREALNKTGSIHFDGELLAHQAIGLAEGDAAGHRQAALFAVRAHDPAWFARMMLARSYNTAGRDLGSVPVHGFTLAPMQSHAALDWAIAEPALRIVSLVRSNLLALYADLLDAQSAAIGKSASLHFEPDRFARFVGLQQHQAAALRDRLVRRNGDTVEIDSSHLNVATLAELIGFLTDLPSDPSALAGLAPTAGRQVDRFANPDAVLTCLAALDQSAWAGEEGALGKPD